MDKFNLSIFGKETQVSLARQWLSMFSKVKVEGFLEERGVAKSVIGEVDRKVDQEKYLASNAKAIAYLKGEDYELEVSFLIAQIQADIKEVMGWDDYDLEGWKIKAGVYGKGSDLIYKSQKRKMPKKLSSTEHVIVLGAR